MSKPKPVTASFILLYLVFKDDTSDGDYVCKCAEAGNSDIGLQVQSYYELIKAALQLVAADTIGRTIKSLFPQSTK